MGIKSKIEWTDATWNPITGCTPISEGCENCYAKREAESRLRGQAGYDKDNPFKVTFHSDRLDQPSRWAKPRKIFVCSMGDLFHEDVPLAWINDVFRTIQQAQQHTFIILTKRPDRMKKYMKLLLDVRGWPKEDIPFSNVWLGVTVENQQRANERIPLLIDTPAAVRFVSAEPMLGPIDLSNWFIETCTCCGGQGLVSDLVKGPIVPTWATATRCCDKCGGVGKVSNPRLSWIICGGETGKHARPMYPDWVGNLKFQCNVAKVPFFFKSWGEWGVDDKLNAEPDLWIHPSGKTLQDPANKIWEKWVPLRKMGKKQSGRLLDGRTWDEFPEGVE